MLAFGDPREMERKQQRQGMSVALGEMGADDDETFEWEMAQIRKGTGATGDEMASVSQLRAAVKSHQLLPSSQSAQSASRHDMKGVTVALVDGEVREALEAMQVCACRAFFGCAYTPCCSFQRTKCSIDSSVRESGGLRVRRGRGGR